MAQVNLEIVSIVRKGSRGKFPLAESRGSASGGVWGNAPTVPQETCMPKRSQQRRRQRSVPASNFALPQERPPAAHSTTHILSRQMGATDQHETRFVFHCWSFFVAEDFASAETTRGLCGCALWPASHCTSMFLDFYRCKGNCTRKCRNFGTQKSPPEGHFASSRRRLYWLTSFPTPSRPSSGQHPKSRRAASG